MGLLIMYDRHGIPIEVLPGEVSTYEKKGYQVAHPKDVMNSLGGNVPYLVPGSGLSVDDLLQALLGEASGGGGGGGRGRVEPVYAAPDRRTVEEAAEAQMVGLLGQVDEAALAKTVDAYMKAHRQAWEGKSVDPNMALLESIRGTEAYKKIHKLRPEGQRESTWVSTYRNAFLQQGGRMGEADERAIDLATVAATPSADTADLFEFSAGHTTGGFFDKIRRQTEVLASKVM